MNILIRSVFLVLVLTFVYSCEEITDWDFKSGDNGILAVEAIITDEFKIHEILLSLSSSSPNDLPSPATGADIVLNAGNEAFHFTEDILHPGIYKSEKAFSAKLNTDYILEILWNNTVYTAENYMVQIIPFTPVTFKTVVGTDSLTFDQVPPAFSPHEQAMYEIIVDWSGIVPAERTQAKYLFYTLSTIDVNQVFKPAKQTPIFPKGSKVIEKKYSLNNNAADYFRAVLMETEWQGGAFDEASAPVRGNINNGAFGYFGVCAVLSDTLIAQ